MSHCLTWHRSAVNGKGRTLALLHSDHAHYHEHHVLFMDRHLCKEERSKPIADQIGSRKCLACKRWFRCAGGLAVHKCRPDDDRSTCPVAGPSFSAPNSVAAVPVPARTHLSLPCCQAHCSASSRCCRSKRGVQLHSCAKYNRTLVGR